MIPGTYAALARLLILQASWTYERLQGIGAGFATLPLLADLRPDPARYRAAVARSVGYFNAHPYLAGVAVGAAARAEYDGVAGETIERLRTALSGPLGALGDQLFWIGVVPAVVGGMLVGAALGGGLAVVALGLAGYVALRLAVTVWGLRTGLAHGAEVAAALTRSGLAERVARIGALAGFVVGLTLPVVVSWYWTGGLPPAALAGGLGALGGALAGRVRRRLPSARRVTLIVLGAAILARWSLG